MKSKILTVLLIAFSVISCSSDDDKIKTYPEENPLEGYLSQSGFNEKETIFKNSGLYEFGYRFKVNVMGKINAVTFKIPDNANNVRVTIWNSNTRVPLKNFIIPSVQANQEIKHVIEPFAVDPSIEYAITYLGDDWYKRTKNNNSDVQYPFSVGNINITGYSWGSATNNEFIYPNIPNSKHYYGGDLSIVFQRLE